MLVTMANAAPWPAIASAAPEGYGFAGLPIDAPLSVSPDSTILLRALIDSLVTANTDFNPTEGDFLRGLRACTERAQVASELGFHGPSACYFGLLCGVPAYATLVLDLAPAPHVVAAYVDVIWDTGESVDRLEIASVEERVLFLRIVQLILDRYDIRELTWDTDSPVIVLPRAADGSDLHAIQTGPWMTDPLWRDDSVEAEDRHLWGRISVVYFGESWRSAQARRAEEERSERVDRARRSGF